ncbi:MAG: P-II family nitrogen regulator [Chitinophagales bacterium]
MKKIIAIIRSSKFEEVREALSGIGINFFTFLEVKGFGRQKGEEVSYRGAVYDVGYIARIQLELIVPEDQEDAVVNCIRAAAQTGEVGDGKIFVSNIDRVVSIRTGDEGIKGL